MGTIIEFDVDELEYFPFTGSDSDSTYFETTPIGIKIEFDPTDT